MVESFGDRIYDSSFCLELEEYQWKTRTGHGKFVFDSAYGVNIGIRDRIVCRKQY